MYQAKVRADLLLEKKRQKKLAKGRYAEERKVKKKMGLLRYYLCPCLRVYYDPSRADELLTEDQKADRAAKLAALRRQQDLDAKNPQTAYARKFLKKVDPEQGGSEEAVVEKHLKTERHREARSTNRAQRRSDRQNDDDLKHKSRTNLEDSN